MASPLARHLASQSVHLTIHPPPQSLSESKRVLSALQKYGEVVTFRNLKYDQTNTNPSAPRNTIAVFESPQAAKSAIANSPLSIPLPSHSSSSFATTSTSTSPSTSASSSTSTRSKTLTCTLQPSRHNHLSALHRNPCYGSFSIEKESYQATDLRKTGIPVAELADVPVRWKLASGRGRGHTLSAGGADVGERGRGKKKGMGGLSLQEMYNSSLSSSSSGDWSGDGVRED
ncbi:hypothetical protein P170DRAFT_219119 [Aspergillus steynii IBT 23096]|uniref:Uncharacterized protein n=1 Tax=Aspergillus steynii IBT 23096 TaxID=1392250 RepID=A0A2I2G1B8_9EURO|nr:uncharacterized protein P170DRAFT_219119 [Aspergillus steynii IBT 23096]PLB46670.1 hypothetical protein P170DRAFT_219119 [Aspergillus steynii IBT 23096]